jgi:hypothetical protein
MKSAYILDVVEERLEALIPEIVNEAELYVDGEFLTNLLIDMKLSTKATLIVPFTISRVNVEKRWLGGVERKGVGKYTIARWAIYNVEIIYVSKEFADKPGNAEMIERARMARKDIRYV